MRCARRNLKNPWTRVKDFCGIGRCFCGKSICRKICHADCLCRLVEEPQRQSTRWVPPPARDEAQESRGAQNCCSIFAVVGRVLLLMCLVWWMVLVGWVCVPMSRARWALCAVSCPSPSERNQQGSPCDVSETTDGNHRGKQYEALRRSRQECCSH